MKPGMAVLAAALLLHPACSDSAGSPVGAPLASASPHAAGSPKGGAADDPEQRVHVTRDTDAGPAACSPQAVGELIVAFFEDVNEEAFDVARFAPDFEWFSVTEWTRATAKRHFVTSDPEKLTAYFQRRAEQDERLRLLEVDVDYEQPGHLGHIAFAIERRANDLHENAPIATGKGAVDCATGTLAVWSMAHDARRQPALGLCPGKPEPPRVAIACARN